MEPTNKTSKNFTIDEKNFFRGDPKREVDTVSKVAFKNFSYLKEEGQKKLHAFYNAAYHKCHRVYVELTHLFHLLFSKWFSLYPHDFQTFAAKTAASGRKILQDLIENPPKLSDPISPKINSVVVASHKPVRMIEALHFATVMGDEGLYSAMMVSEIYQSKISSIVNKFSGKSMAEEDGFVLSSTHPETDKFVFQAGISSATWLATKSFSLVSSSEGPIVILRTMAIFAGSSPHLHRYFLNSSMGKQIQGRSHEISDITYNFAKKSVKEGLICSWEILPETSKQYAKDFVFKQINRSAQNPIGQFVQEYEDKTPDIFQWSFRKKIVPTYAPAFIEQVKEKALDQVSEIVLSQAWNVTKVMITKHCFMKSLQRMATKHRVIAAVALVAEGGKDQTIQEFGIRSITGAAIVYTSSMLAAPVMYTFFAVQFGLGFLDEYYQDRRNEIITEMKQKGRNDDQIQLELEMRDLDEPLQKQFLKYVRNGVFVAMKAYFPKPKENCANDGSFQQMKGSMLFRNYREENFVFQESESVIPQGSENTESLNFESESTNTDNRFEELFEHMNAFEN